MAKIISERFMISNIVQEKIIPHLSQHITMPDLDQANAARKYWDRHNQTTKVLKVVILDNGYGYIRPLTGYEVQGGNDVTNAKFELELIKQIEQWNK